MVREGTYPAALDKVLTSNPLFERLMVLNQFLGIAGLQVHQVLAGELAAERKYLNQRQPKLGQGRPRVGNKSCALARVSDAHRQGSPPSFRQAELTKVFYHSPDRGGRKHHRLLEF
jgi:hypothetical protein